MAKGGGGSRGSGGGASGGAGSSGRGTPVGRRRSASASGTNQGATARRVARNVSNVSPIRSR